MTQLALAFSQVHKHFGAQHVLRGVDLAIESGSIHFIMGRSGAGKSILIKHVAGLVQADAGSIRFFGEELFGLSEAQFAGVGLHQAGDVLDKDALAGAAASHDEV
ncbi:MAG: ATP-binding cassette domain-containing protein, partial [Deltaproteobacteria bacterium]